MTPSSVDLRELGPCFEGIVPATIATLSADGTPNISFVSHVHLVDSRHIATSYQFFSKTRKNLLENPRANVKIWNPFTLQPYLIKARFLRSEFEGPLFDSMAIKLKIIASHEGMTEIFKLKAADVFEVLEVRKVENYTSASSPTEQPPATDHACKIEMLQVLTERMAKTSSVEELFHTTMNLLAQFFGYTHMKILLTTETPNALVTHYSHGYEENGAGSEISFGDGIIGQAAEVRKPLQISGVDPGLRYVQASRESVNRTGLAKHLGPRIPLPGLPNPASQIAIPIISGDSLLGVFALESNEQSYWSRLDMSVLSVVVNQLASCIRGIDSSSENAGEAAEIDRNVNDLPTPTKPARAAERIEIKYIAADETIFFNDVYLIKNIPAKILWHVLKTYSETGRQDFSNKELRSLSHLQLPEIKDNLESRLVLLRKRLEQQCDPIRIHPTGRGRFRVEVAGRLTLS